MGRNQHREIDQNSTKNRSKSRSISRSKSRSKSRRSHWLEEKVAQHKREQLQDKHHEEDMAGSFSTLSTKDTLGHKNFSEESNTPVVRMPMGGIRTTSRNNNGENNQDDDNFSKKGNKDLGENDIKWSVPDTEVAGQVWEKALAKHGEQNKLHEQVEGRCGNDAEDSTVREEVQSEKHGELHLAPLGEKKDEGGHESLVRDPAVKDGGNGDPQDDLSSGWEAILDPASGDYYYNNWETGEVTWDRPEPGGGISGTEV